jgi:hypothetical protein
MNESVEIKINLSSNYWENRCPSARVYIDDILLFDNCVDTPIEINWSGAIFDGSHKIIVEMYNKKQGDTIVVDNTIVHDVLLNVDSIAIDDIELDQLIWAKSIYYPEDAHAPNILENCINLGWNGKWVLEFSSPVYLWLLENF